MSKDIKFDYKFGVKLIKSTLNKLPNGSGVYKFINYMTKFYILVRQRILKKGFPLILIFQNIQIGSNY